MSRMHPAPSADHGVFGVRNEAELRRVLFDLEAHWRSPCSTCPHKGGSKTHAARTDALERLIVGGWLDPARVWPFEVPAFLRPLMRDGSTTDAGVGSQNGSTVRP